MTMMLRLVFALSLPFVTMAQDFCTSENNVFHVKVNLFAGELGTCRPCLLFVLGESVIASRTCTLILIRFSTIIVLLTHHSGYFEVEECEGPNPTIGMEYGQTYTFMQTDVSNYYHPM